MYFITIKRMLEVCFSAHPNIQYRAGFSDSMSIIRYDSIRDYHVMNVRDLVFVMAAAGGIYRR